MHCTRAKCISVCAPFEMEQRFHGSFALMMLACLALCLSACAAPTAQVPVVSAQELSAEAERQKQFVNQQATKVDYESVQFSPAQLSEFETRLSRISQRLAPQAIRVCREMNGPEADCNMRIELDRESNQINAYADGERIVVNAAMMDFTKGQDEQLAFVLAHEYTHHMMGHVSSAKQNVLLGSLGGLLVDVAAASQGIDTGGQFSGLGGQVGRLRYSPSFEQEADYVALYMLERAGFDTGRAPAFWRRMAQSNPQGMFNRTTHPTTPERFVLMEKTIQEIQAKKRSGQRLLPNMQPED